MWYIGRKRCNLYIGFAFAPDIFWLPLLLPVQSCATGDAGGFKPTHQVAAGMNRSWDRVVLSGGATQARYLFGFARYYRSVLKNAVA
jgi:hypothetical protein